jgi:hypothetical protein
VERKGGTSSRLIEDRAAAVAFQKILPSLKREKGNKKETQVMVNPGPAGGRKTALGAEPRLVIHPNLLRLYPANEEKEDPPPKPGRLFSSRFLNY